MTTTQQRSEAGGAGEDDRAHLEDLLRRVKVSASAYIRGDVDTYVELIEHSEDFTLMSPFGGPTVHGFEWTAEAREETRRYFRSGEAAVELEQVYTSGDLAVLVLVERQHGEVGGLPDQDWSLRVTLVFRSEPLGWQLVHRHADALVHPISLDVLSELAQGTATARSD
jgi:ketosteroid isomerase-like protein